MNDKSSLWGFLILVLTFIVLAAPALSAADYVHRDYDWEGDDANEQDPPAEPESCFACHFGMYPPPGAKRKVCEDCHAINETPGYPNGPYTYYDLGGGQNFSLRDDYNQSVLIVYEHFYSSAVSTCLSFDPNTGEGICHGVAYSYKKYAGGYFSFNESRIKSRCDPYLYAVSSIFLPNSTNCLFCHNQTEESVRNAWGNATQTLLHYNATMNEDCYRCHVEGAKNPTSFHSQEIFLMPEETSLPLKEGTVVLALIISVVGIYLIRRKQH